MTLTAIAKDVHGLSLGPVNVFLIEDGRDLILIDTGLPGNADKVLAAIAQLGREPGDLKHLILTHAHADHIGSAAALAAATGAQTWMHPLDVPIAEGRERDRPITPAPNPLMKAMHLVMSLAKPAPVAPVTINHPMGDGDVLSLAGGLTVIHVPGHCAGQVAILWRGRDVLFVADCCGHLFGLGEPLGYEDREEGLRSQRKLAGLDFEIACFGHGKPILRGAGEQFRKRWGRLPQLDKDRIAQSA